MTTKKDLPLASTTKFSTNNATAIAAGSGAYGTYTNPGTGDFILGSALPKARKYLVTIPVVAIAGTPTALKVALMKADDANGTNAAEIASTVTEFASPAADTEYETEIDPGAVDDLAKFYGIGLAVNGASSSVTATASTSVRLLDPVFKS